MESCTELDEPVAYGAGKYSGGNCVLFFVCYNGVKFVRYFWLDRRNDLHWFRLWLVVGCGIIIAVFYLSLTPPIDLPAEHTDKIFHALTYALLMAWFVQLFHGARSYCLLALAFIVMGASIEVLQSFHPLRYFDVWDMTANAVGVIIVWCISRGGFVSLLQKFEQCFLRKK